MKLLLLLITLAVGWDYLLFVQLWPGSWITGKSSFNNSYFTIHGIWPQYYNNSWPQYCTHEQFNFTAIKPIYNDLVTYWTDFKNPPEFWLHEFRKHATCAEDDPALSNELKFFTTGLSLRKKYELFSILKNNFIIPSNQIKYPTDRIANIISEKLGYDIVVICDEHDILNEIRICLDKNLTQFNCPDLEKEEECQQTYVAMNIV